MILNETKKDVTVSGNFEQTQFKLKADPKAFNILSDKIYTHKVRAVIREISTNAVDAHIEAGNPEPFDVHLPTAIESWFSVRDYGTGLSHEDCMSIYTTYFHSTKTKSNDVTGCLGLGSKSPYAIADSFTVVSFYNGKKRTYSAYKDENDCPQFALLTEADTDEPNGVEVSVNVPDHLRREFEVEAELVYAYFKDIPNINVKSVAESAQAKLSSYRLRTDEFATNGDYGSIKCVMGNVCYSLDSDIDHELDRCPLVDTDITIFFDMGELSFTPGRESLSLDEKTRTNIRNKLDSVQSALIEELQKEVLECDSYYDARRLYISFNSRRHKVSEPVNWTDGIWKRCVKNPPELDEFITVYHKESHSKSVTKLETKRTFYDDNTQYFWKERGYVARIREYLSGQDKYAHHRIALVEQKDIDGIGIPADKVRNLEELPKATATGTKIRGSACKIFTMTGSSSWRHKQNWTEAEVDLNDGVQRVYVTIDRWKVSGSSYWLEDARDVKDALKTLGLQDVVVYGVKKAMVHSKKFQQANFVKLYDFIKEKVQGMSVAGNLSFGGNRSMADAFKGIAGEFGGDFQKFADLHNQYKNQNSSLVNLLNKLGIEVKSSTELDDIYNNLLTKYPMLDIIDSWSINSNIDKVVNYIKLVEDNNG